MNHDDLQNIPVKNEGCPIVASESTITNSDSFLLEESPLSDDEKQDGEDCIQKHICGKCHKSFRRFSEFKKHSAFCQFDSDYHLRKADMMKNTEKIEREAINMESTSCSSNTYKTISCEVCKQMFSRLDSLQEHLKRHLNTQLTKTEENMCPICKNCFSNLSILKKHKLEHRGDRPFACDFCDRKFPVLSLLIKHRRSHTGEKPYTCAERNQSFSAKGLLNRHMKLHTSEKPYTCAKCNQCFTTEEMLKQHTKRHTDEKPYICTECDQCFAIKDSVNLHIELHTIRTPHVCNESGISFDTTRLHIQHPFDCNQCKEKLKSSKQDVVPERQLITDEGSETTTKQLVFENEVCSTVENQSIKIEPKTSISKGLRDVNISNRPLVEEDTTVQQLNENEEPERTTEQLLLNNELYTIITLENENIKLKQKTIIPEDVIESTNEDQTLVKGEVVVEEEVEVEDNITEIVTEQLLENHESCSVITHKTKSINIETRNAIPETGISLNSITYDIPSIDNNLAKQVKKDEPHQISRQQLLKNAEFTVTTLENKRIKLELETAIPETVVGTVAIQQSIKFEAAETNSEELLLENELYSVITLESENIKIEPVATVSESLTDVITDDRTSIADEILLLQFTEEEEFENNSKQVKNSSCSLKQHIKEHKSGDNINKSAILKKRKGIQQGEGPFTCDFCKKKFPVLSVLENHRRSHTGEKPYTCTECKQCFAHKQALNHHMTRHTGEKPYSCTTCNKSFAVKESLKRHLKIHTGEKPFACSECNQCFAIKEALNLHMRRHTGEKPFTCTECNQCFSRKQALSAHMMRHTGERPYMCTECKHCFARKQGLELHMKRHSGEKPFICTECSQCFATKESLNRHMKLHTGEKPFTCPECNRRFAFKLALKRHMRRHTGEKPHTCTECNKSFGVKQELKRHMRQHTGEKPYKCTMCDQSFNIKDSLNRHINRHTGIKPHTCSECNKSFTVKESLNRHIKLHSGEKPYSCTECNNSFAVKQALKRHMRQHTGEKPYKCTECNESFNVNDSLKRHMRRHAEEILRIQQMQSKLFS
ncbi:zinc finger protein 23-like [Teleopsis dalmanni]|uniref:zinc finger protein 23-like n=1 Tax=Teleopsis dalmanni TaxID=139649 RepID=UPI0018CF956C|nr:zinc finger protein 23-like [Teleopsis dalmanni]